MCNQTSHDHLRSSQVAQAVTHSNYHPLQHLRPNGVEHNTVVTFLIKTACATLRHMGANLLLMEISRTNACFKDRMHQCMEAYQHFKPGTREWWAGSEGNLLNTENKRRNYFSHKGSYRHGWKTWRSVQQPRRKHRDDRSQQELAFHRIMLEIRDAAGRDGLPTMEIA